MAGVDPGIINLIIFVLAVFVGCHAVSNAAPPLYAPLTAMAGTLSGVIVVGALYAAGAGHLNLSTVIGFLAVAPAAVSLVGGFLLSQRLLRMSKKSDR